MYKEKGASQIVIILISCLVVAALSGVAVYYFSVGKSQVEKKKVEDELENLKKDYEKLRAENEQLKATSVDETENWKTFSSSEYGYSIKYPASWIYKDYGKLAQGSKMVAFADKTSNLPAEQSDQPAIIGISIADQAIVAGNLSQCPNNVKKETVTIGSNISATKWTTLPGCADDMFGDSKFVTIEAKKSKSKYINIENFNDKELEIFEKMLTTFKLI